MYPPSFKQTLSCEWLFMIKPTTRQVCLLCVSRVALYDNRKAQMNPIIAKYLPDNGIMSGLLQVKASWYT